MMWLLVRRLNARVLNADERERYAPYIAPDVLDAARVIEGHVPFWLRRDMQGVTLGHRIFLRPGAYDARRVEGISLLGHELVHVRQYRQGMTLLRYVWASRRGYRRNAYEIEAYAIGAQIRADVSAACLARRGLAAAASAVPGQPTSMPSIARANASATSIPSTAADMIPPA
jgi:hypothetical protein